MIISRRAPLVDPRILADVTLVSDAGRSRRDCIFRRRWGRPRSASARERGLAYQDRGMSCVVRIVIVASEHRETLKLKIASPTQLASSRMAPAVRFGIHPIWLRERCQDAQSMDLLTGQRLHDPSDLDLGLTLMRRCPRSGPGRLHIRFSDGHEAEFLARDILDGGRAMPPGEHDVPALRDSWTGSARGLCRAPHGARNPADAELSGVAGAVSALRLHHFQRRSNRAPRRVGGCAGVRLHPRDQFWHRVRRAFGAERHGPGLHPREARPAHRQPLSVAPVPGVQLLHCLANETTGGLSTLVDGCAVGEALRRTATRRRSA